MCAKAPIVTTATNSKHQRTHSSQISQIQVAARQSEKSAQKKDLVDQKIAAELVENQLNAMIFLIKFPS